MLVITGISYNEVIKIALDDEYKNLLKKDFLDDIEQIKKYIAFFKEITLSDDKNENFEKIKSLYEKIKKYIYRIAEDKEIDKLFDFAFDWSMKYKDKIAPESDYFSFFKRIMKYHENNEGNWGLKNNNIDNLLNYNHSFKYIKQILNKNFINYCFNIFKKALKDNINFLIEVIKKNIENEYIFYIFPFKIYSEKLVKLFNKAFPQFRGLKVLPYSTKEEAKNFNKAVNERDCYVVLWFPDEDAEWIGSRNGEEASRKKRFKNKDTYLVFNDMDDKHKVSGDNVINNDISVKEENRL